MTETTTTTIADVLAGIDYLSSEEECKAVFDAANRRIKAIRQRIAAEARLTMKVGDRVRLKGLSPKYLNGAQGVIIAKTDRGFTVKVDEHYFRAYNRGLNGELGIPASCVEVVE